MGRQRERPEKALVTVACAEFLARLRSLVREFASRDLDCNEFAAVVEESIREELEGRRNEQQQ